MTDIARLIAANKARWDKAKITRGPEFDAVAKRLAGPFAKKAYQEIERDTGVPWFVVAVIHEREASQNWGANIAQGDPWNRPSVHVPRGRGPFSSWREAANDALKNCAPYAAKWKDWSPGGAMTLLEEYNGLGYASRGIPSPYIWSGTDQYHSGKYVSDGVFDPNAVDRQLGCAGLILAMAKIDSSVNFGAPIPAPPDVPTPTPQPAPAEPVWISILKAILSLFTRK